MKTIQELIGNEATGRLKERYGILVDRIVVREEFGGIFSMTLQLLNRKQLSPNSTGIELEREIGIGIAEIEQALYRVLHFDDENMEQGIHFNNNLPRNGIHMHREIYKELMGSERESMRRIEERLEQLNKKKEIDR